MTVHCQGWNFWNGGVKSLMNLLPQKNTDQTGQNYLRQPFARSGKGLKGVQKTEQYLFNKIHLGCMRTVEAVAFKPSVSITPAPFSGRTILGRFDSQRRTLSTHC